MKKLIAKHPSYPSIEIDLNFEKDRITATATNLETGKQSAVGTILEKSTIQDTKQDQK